MKKEEKKCPLSTVDWVNYIMQEESIYYFKFYNEVLSKFTIMIVLLTILNFLLIIGTSTSDIPFINTNIKNAIFLCALVLIVGVIIFMAWVILIKLPAAAKKYRDSVINNENEIISDILHGKEKDSDNILKRRKEI
jgi:magnesium-transporting ATPase (P-type)